MPEAKKNKRELPEHLRVPWKVRDVLLVVLTWFGVQFGLGIWLVVFSRYMPWVRMFLDAVRDGEIWASFILNMVGIVLGFTLVALFLRHYHAGWRTVGWRPVSLKTTIKYLAGILLVFFLLAQVALFLISVLVPGFNADQPQTNEFTSGAGSHRSLALVALVLLPPVFEETIFRGFIFPAIAKRTGLIWGAILSSLLFGLAHGQANIFVYTFILGLFLCFMYVRTRSIIPGILLHMLNNYLAFLALSGK